MTDFRHEIALTLSEHGGAANWKHALELADHVLAIATEARRAGTVEQGPVHEGAGRQASPKDSPPDTSGATP